MFEKLLYVADVVLKAKEEVDTTLLGKYVVMFHNNSIAKIETVESEYAGTNFDITLKFSNGEEWCFQDYELFAQYEEEEPDCLRLKVFENEEAAKKFLEDMKKEGFEDPIDYIIKTRNLNWLGDQTMKLYELINAVKFDDNTIVKIGNGCLTLKECRGNIIYAEVSYVTSDVSNKEIYNGDIKGYDDDGKEIDYIELPKGLLLNFTSNVVIVVKPLKEYYE